MKRALYILIVLLTLFVIESCSPHASSCTEETYADMTVDLYRMEYDSRAEEYRAKEYSLEVMINGVGSDSILYDGRSVKSLALPLHRFSEKSAFNFEYYDADQNFYIDTIFIEHTNIEKFVSLECGCGVDFTINKATCTTNGMDSVVLKINEVTPSQKKANLYIYFK